MLWELFSSVTEATESGFNLLLGLMVNVAVLKFQVVAGKQFSLKFAAL